MKNLLSEGLAVEMIGEACKIAVKYGLKTRNRSLLEKAAANEFLAVKNGRIFPSAELMKSSLNHLEGNNVPEGDLLGNHHGWQDMIINHSSEEKLRIQVTDLPHQFCDYKNRQIIPLTREKVIEGTKLLHVLAEKKGVRAYSCGVPQDTPAPLKAVEQYLIGFMYNRNGGGTIQAVDQAVEKEFSKIRAIAEDREDENERNLMLFSPSPLILDSDDLYLCFQPGIKLNSFMVGSMPMMGMTGPVDPVGVYVLALAEVLGGAAILHALFPSAKAYLYPHPQSMNPFTGQMAFGTVEHARLEMIKLQVMKTLNLPYYNVKDIMTSAQMPGSMAQGDKALGFFTGMAAGYKAYNLMPLSTDQVWSPEQALLDIEAIEEAWQALQPLNYENIGESVIETHAEVLENEGLFGESMDTLMNMHLHYRTDVLHKRYQTSETWQAAERPEELNAIVGKKEELLSSWNYQAPAEKLEKIMVIYHNLCRRYDTKPVKPEL